MSSSQDPESRMARLLRHSGWLVSAQLASNLAAIAQALIVTRALGATAYGIYVLVAAYVAFVSNLFNSRVWLAIAKFVPEFRTAKQYDKAAAVFQVAIFLEAVGAFLAWTAVVAFGHRAVAWIPGSDESLIRLCACLPLINALGEPLRAIVRVAERFAWLTAQAVMLAMLQTSGIAVVWYFGATIERVLLVQIAASTFSVLFLFVLGSSAAGQLRLPIWQISSISLLKGDFQRVCRFIVVTNLTATSAMLSSIDRLLLAIFVAPAAVGAYDLARKIVDQLNQLVVPIRRAAFHEMSEMISGQRFRDARQLQAKLTRSLLKVVLPICTAVSLTAPTVIPVIFGAEFAAAGVVLQILIWQLLKVPLAWFRGFMLCIDRAGTMMCLKWSQSLLSIVLMLLLIPPLGIVGASWASLICTLLWIVLAVLLTSRLDPEFLSLSYGTHQSSASEPVRSAA